MGSNYTRLIQGEAYFGGCYFVLLFVHVIIFFVDKEFCFGFTFEVWVSGPIIDLRY
tara:strand:- start:338 stop:505 length:168 start_codon:yes stop_codon:yes gene_type:complete